MKDNLPVILTVIVLFASEISTSSLIENEQLMLLRTQVNDMQIKLDSLINQVSEEKILRHRFQAKNSELETQISQLVAENVGLSGRIDDLQAEFRDQIQQLTMLQREKQETDIGLHQKMTNQNIFEPSHANKNVDIASDESYAEFDSSPRLPPSSCRQLSTIGHYLDGIYLVANPDTNRIETVYCDFGSSTLSETLFGNVEVKTKSVHFYVQRSSDLASTNVVIPFDVERLNIGGAMNLATGIFTVPVDGIYHFEFSGLRDLVDSSPIGIFLRVNGARIGSCYSANLPNYFMSFSGINASLRLKSGDQVTLYKDGGTLYDDAGHWTHFTGWLVEEDLVLG